MFVSPLHLGTRGSIKYLLCILLLIIIITVTSTVMVIINLVVIIVIRYIKENPVLTSCFLKVRLKYRCYYKQLTTSQR